MGLGLSISRQIVDEHGGTISVESSPGRTTFTVEIPTAHTDTTDTTDTNHTEPA